MAEESIRKIERRDGSAGFVYAGPSFPENVVSLVLPIHPNFGQICKLHARQEERTQRCLAPPKA